MAWEQRNGKSYYYRKRREGGRVVSEYVGHKVYAHLAAWEDDVDRTQREIDRREIEELKQACRRVDQAVDGYHKVVRKFEAVVLRRAGFHQHKRQWRLKRKVSEAMADVPVKQITDNEVENQYFALMRAAKGKKQGKALEQFREYARAHPHLFDDFGMLRKTTLDAVVNFCTNDDVTRIHLEGEAKSLRRRLGSADASPLEQLLIDDIVHCWLRVMAYEQTYSANFAAERNPSMATVQHVEKRLSIVQRRYHRAIESLARVRGLLARAGVQINIAQQQVVQNNL